MVISKPLAIAAALLPMFTAVAESVPPLAMVTTLLRAAPLPIVNAEALLDQTEPLPRIDTCWLLRPLPTV